MKLNEMKLHYKKDDLNCDFYEIVGKAKQLWASYCRENFARDGDTGSCVLGAGISIMYIPPRCKKPRPLMIISSREVSCCQGSSNWEINHDKVVQYLLDHNINAFYTWGNLD